MAMTEQLVLEVRVAVTIRLIAELETADAQMIVIWISGGPSRKVNYHASFKCFQRDVRLQ